MAKSSDGEVVSPFLEFILDDISRFGALRYLPAKIISSINTAIVSVTVLLRMATCRSAMSTAFPPLQRLSGSTLRQQLPGSSIDKFNLRYWHKSPITHFTIKLSQVHEATSKNFTIIYDNYLYESLLQRQITCNLSKRNEQTKRQTKTLPLGLILTWIFQKVHCRKSSRWWKVLE